MNKRIQKKRNLQKYSIRKQTGDIIFYTIIFKDEEDFRMDKYIKIKAKNDDEALEILEDFIDKSYEDGEALSSVMVRSEEFININ